MIQQELLEIGKRYEIVVWDETDDGTTSETTAAVGEVIALEDGHYIFAKRLSKKYIEDNIQSGRMKVFELPPKKSRWSLRQRLDRISQQDERIRELQAEVRKITEICRALREGIDWFRNTHVYYPDWLRKIWNPIVPLPPTLVGALNKFVRIKNGEDE